MPQAGRPIIYEPGGRDEDADMDDYEGMPDMSSEVDAEDEAEECCPVPDTENDSRDNDSEAEEPVPRQGEAIGRVARGVVRFRNDDADSDMLSLREPSHSHKKAKLLALPAKPKTWHQDLA